MSAQTRLDRVFAESETVYCDNNSKFVVFSDCHRGDGSRADDFMKNRDIFNSALDYYYKNGYTYIEAGDGDELWENRHFSTIYNVHRNTFLRLKRFYDDRRLYFIYGNHDIEKTSRRFPSKNTLFSCCLFKSIKLHEALILEHVKTKERIFIVHGHQGDLLNDRLWLLSRFFVRYILRAMQIYGIDNPLSPAVNSRRKEIIEDRLKQWAKRHNTPIIAGHTHRPCTPGNTRIPYYNCGSCTKPGGITCIEITGPNIKLAEWNL